VRLGTYTGKVPVYNALKAAKGTMFLLPLDLHNTLERLDKAGYTSDSTVDELLKEYQGRDAPHYCELKMPR